VKHGRAHQDGEVLDYAEDDEEEDPVEEA